MKNLTTKKLTYVGLFAALTFVSNYLQIPFVTPFGNTRFHLGNVFCLLSGIILGPLYGGLAAGIGPTLFDLFDPVYFTSAPTTFINKFAMAAVAGYIFNKGFDRENKTRLILASILGQLTYIILYLGKTFIKNYYILNLTFEASMVELAQKAGVSLLNGLISVIFASIIAIPLLKAVKFE
ncbi:ECF transporter S component [uncultured Anaerococcus sp.]|uniref:ECF transporter S component n=1 Tax=uncultured Anaerococcus sp. TaxID=293428 RepID=UPI0025F8B873|nr:ECF transporter S component [uncultured Anaerococcus sp.]